MTVGGQVQGAASFTLVEEGLMESGAELSDDQGRVVTRFEPGDKRRQAVTFDDGSLFLTTSQWLFKLKMDAVEGEQTVAHLEGDELTSGDQTYSLKRKRRSIPVPWVLSIDGNELASFTRHLNHQIDIELTGTQPVPMMLIIVGCQWARMKASQKAGAS